MPSSPALLAPPARLGMQENDVNAIFGSSFALHSALQHPQCTLTQLVKQIGILGNHLTATLTHHTQTAAAAHDINWTQHAQNALNFKQQMEGWRYGDPGFFSQAIMLSWDQLRNSLAEKMEQVRRLRRTLDPGASDNVVESVFANLVSNDFLIDPIARRL